MITPPRPGLTGSRGVIPGHHACDRQLSEAASGNLCEGPQMLCEVDTPNTSRYLRRPCMSWTSTSCCSGAEHMRFGDSCSSIRYSRVQPGCAQPTWRPPPTASVPIVSKSPLCENAPVEYMFQYRFQPLWVFVCAWQAGPWSLEQQQKLGASRKHHKARPVQNASPIAPQTHAVGRLWGRGAGGVPSTQ